MNHAPAVPPLAFHDGRTIPQLGLGVWQISDDDSARIVQAAIATGYRHIDTARIYENERGVGDAVASCGLDRDELFVTTKLWNSDQGRDATLAAFDASCDRLSLDEVDLYLIHWPYPMLDRFVESWATLVELQAAGRARSIGVSNFHIDHLERVIDATGVVPVINQVELHPYQQQRELRAFHDSHDIRTQCWSPLGQGGELLRDPVLATIASRHGMTTAQVVLRWHIQEQLVVIPKSGNPGRIAENIDVFGFELDDDDMASIRGLDRGNDGRIGPDPAQANFA